MTSIELQRMIPEETVQGIETFVKQHRENKYAFQVGLKDLDFDINEELLKLIGLTIPFQSIVQAEQALRYGAIKPTLLIEEDDTEHQVLIFDPRTVENSGFMNCVTHSLALSNLGVFEVARYSAVNLTSQIRGWQWFLHRRIMDRDEVNKWEDNMTQNELMEALYKAYCYD